MQLDWAEDRYDQPISESDIQRVCREGELVDVDKANLMAIWFLSQGICAPWCFEFVRNTKTEVGLDSWETTESQV